MSSTSLTTSTTSGSIILGPGALSGKAILALGKLTLRGAEFVIIRRRLHAIANKFPIADAAYFEGIEQMYDDLLELSRSLDESVMHDICIDSMELVASKSMDMKVRIQALKLLYLFSCRGKFAAQSIIRDHLLTQAREHSIQIISEIIQNLACIHSEKTPGSNLFYSDWDLSDPVLKYAPHFEFLRLFRDLARNDEALLIIFLAADILGLMRPFLEIELRGNSEKQIDFHSGDMLTVYDSRDYSLLQLIKKNGLRHLLQPVERADTLKMHWRAILCRAFDVFLGREKQSILEGFG
ncbi:hypothetical protein C0993_007368 [Termitomyces sp. T159_Od127]|nr:hypothetical protein C0993_007368 [Termitomyces sp. T159_Od127]